jgi:hypothetical protein
MRNFAAFVCVVVAAPAYSATHKLPADDPIATIQIPEKWPTKEYEERVEATSADGTVNFFVMLAETNKVKESMLEAMRYVKGRNGITVKADSEKRDRGQVNGMDIRSFSWKGQDKKGEVKISFTVVSVPENKTLLVVYWGSPQATEKHERVLNQMLQSIQKA